MAMEVLFCNGSHEKLVFNEMLCSLMEKAAIEAAMVVLLAMGSVSKGLNIMDNEAGIDQGVEDPFAAQVRQKGRRDETQVKDDGETDDDDDDDEDEDADEQDDDAGEEPSGEEGNPNEGDEDPEDELEANGEGESDDGEDEDEDDDDDDDEDDDDEEEDDEDEDEEEIPEPPSKKRK